MTYNLSQLQLTFNEVVKPIYKHEKSGRPKAGEAKTMVGYQISTVLKRNEQKIEQLLAQSKGLFERCHIFSLLPLIHYLQFFLVPFELALWLYRNTQQFRYNKGLLV